MSEQLQAEIERIARQLVDTERELVYGPLPGMSPAEAERRVANARHDALDLLRSIGRGERS